MPFFEELENDRAPLEKLSNPLERSCSSTMLKYFCMCKLYKVEESVGFSSLQRITINILLTNVKHSQTDELTLSLNLMHNRAGTGFSFECQL